MRNLPSCKFSRCPLLKGTLLRLNAMRYSQASTNSNFGIRNVADAGLYVSNKSVLIRVKKILVARVVCGIARDQPYFQAVLRPDEERMVFLFSLQTSWWSTIARLLAFPNRALVFLRNSRCLWTLGRWDSTRSRDYFSRICDGNKVSNTFCAFAALN